MAVETRPEYKQELLWLIFGVYGHLHMFVESASATAIINVYRKDLQELHCFLGVFLTE